MAPRPSSNRSVQEGMNRGDMLGFSPPLIVTEADVEEMVARMKRAVDREVDALVAEGVWRLPA